MIEVNLTRWRKITNWILKSIAKAEQKYMINQENFDYKRIDKQFEKRDVSVEHTLKT